MVLKRVYIMKKNSYLNSDLKLFFLYDVGYDKYHFMYYFNYNLFIFWKSIKEIGTLVHVFQKLVYELEACCRDNKIE